MGSARIGYWAFAVPETWQLGEPQDKGSYLKAPDGTRGIHAYALVAIPTEETAINSASAVQQITLESYTGLEGSSWRVLRQRQSTLFGFAASVADIVDQGASYCIRLINICGPGEGLRLAIHEYLCESYDDTCRYFDEIEQSIKYELDAA